ncbi:hypothetical protein [Peribacillus butanolivorans]|uniref:hypothetical protein n=1 Tax=Peribacillus butanolivorans TaxID=421767 RepID=UPI0036DA85FF
MGFGPDGSKQLDENNVGVAHVPKGKRARFDFYAHASWENAACIYEGSSDQMITDPRGNEGRSLDSFTTLVNTTGRDQFFKVTGWHKTGSYYGQRPWIQSRMSNTPSGDYTFAFHFEDQHDLGGEDFQDLQVGVIVF